MTNEVNAAFAAVDQRDGSFCFVCECEDVLAGPRTGAIATVMLWGLDGVLASQPFREGAPLASAGPRAMQSYHPPKASRRLVPHVDGHSGVLSGSGCSVIMGERAINRPFTLHGVRNSRASEPNILERAVAHRAKPVDRRLLDAPSHVGHPPALQAGHHTTHQ